MHAAPTAEASGRDTGSRESLPDHASHADERGVDIDRVGIRGLSWPITVWDRSNKMQPTVATFDATVALPASQKGTHMSRFVEVLNGVRGELSLKNLPGVLAEIQRRLGAEKAQLDVRFPYFMSRKAPVSGAESLMEYRAAFHACRDGDRFDFVLEVRVPVTTLCPCSKAVSERGAHNQRGIVTVELRSDEFVWIEDVVEAVEACASSPLYALLKREDEKYVTERAYDNPVFVEDLLREVTVALRPRATWLRVSVENVESIHNHSAWAVVEHGEAPVRTPVEIEGEFLGRGGAPRNAPPAAMDADAAFGPWLRGQRVSRGWSQQELADRVGVSPPHLSKVECGERSLPASAYEPLGEALGQDADVLRLRAGVVPAAVLARMQADPEGALRWADAR
ncbi:MAG: GTP cyclohydrolase FolE2 [Pseudomonadota bacterium]|nr:GTP cyclohydrolase FolE2 [Pseudomonadota bacterium]